MKTDPADTSDAPEEEDAAELPATADGSSAVAPDASVPAEEPDAEPESVPAGPAAAARRARRPSDPDRRAELEQERVFLLASLEDLEREDEAGDLDQTDGVNLRDAYTARLAAVLRELAGQEAAAAPKTPRRWGRLLAIVAVIGVVAVGAGVAVAVSSGRRLPGAALSGQVADTVNADLAEARSIQETDPKGAIDRYDDVLKTDPNNAEALTYRGWLLARLGATAGAGDIVDRGEADLDQAIKVAPTYADPYCFKAIIELRYRNDAAAAKGPVDTCAAANPPQEVKALVAGLQSDVNAALAGGGAGTGTGSTVAPSTTLGR